MAFDGSSCAGKGLTELRSGEMIMYATARNRKNIEAVPGMNKSQENPVSITALTCEEEGEVLAFLSERPVHTFGMAGFIRSNGMVSPHNRGTFYACRDMTGEIEGVALIGHFILFETQSDRAIEGFARLAKECPSAFMLLAEPEKAQAFWKYYSDGGQEVRLHCRELLFEQGWPVETETEMSGLRVATMSDLDLIVPAHAESALAESGIDPLETDPEGFRRRCAHRIETGKSRVWVEDGRLLFKAEIVSDTPDVVYLEGVWVNPAERGKGIGLRCMSELGRDFLMRTGRVCVLVNEKFEVAQSFYRRAGYSLVSYYDTIYLKQEIN